MLLLLICVQPRRKSNFVLGVTSATRSRLAVVFVYTDRYPSLADILGKLLPFRAAQANLVALEVEIERAIVYQFASNGVLLRGREVDHSAPLILLEEALRTSGNDARNILDNGRRHAA